MVRQGVRRLTALWCILAVGAIAVAGCVGVISDGGDAGQTRPTRFRPPVVTSRPITPGPPATPSPVQATPIPGSSVPPTQRPGSTKTPRPSGEGACGDPTYNLSGFKWEGAFKWYFNADSTPDQYDRDAVLAVLERSVNNIATAFNDCGLADNVDIEAIYKGPTREPPCGEEGTYGLNVIGFGEVPERLGANTIAYTCPYEDNVTGDYVEADIAINRDVDWAMSLEDCQGFEELLEATITHEVGHVFGLDHVTERRHGDLTMSTRSNGACTDDEISLGLGDVLALEELYGPSSN